MLMVGMLYTIYCRMLYSLGRNLIQQQSTNTNIKFKGSSIQTVMSLSRNVDPDKMSACYEDHECSTDYDVWQAGSVDYHWEFYDWWQTNTVDEGL